MTCHLLLHCFITKMQLTKDFITQKLFILYESDGSRTGALFDVLAAFCLSGCDCQTGLFIAAALRPLCPPTQRALITNTPLILACLYFLSCHVHFSFRVFQCQYVTPPSFTFHTVVIVLAENAVFLRAALSLCRVWAFIMFSDTVSLLVLCLPRVDVSALQDCYQKLVDTVLDHTHQSLIRQPLIWLLASMDLVPLSR